MLYGENFCFSDLIPEFSIRAIFALEVLDGCASKGKQQKFIIFLIMRDLLLIKLEKFMVLIIYLKLFFF